ncbi:MAG TPA: hypothetical protein PLO33_01430 [Kouleothrix sp.]|uniref:T4 family baseplate hub assembly chaperone n=1 Tax=Kouleothrix sp. TaxID=2779161 RepID=UPI002B6FBF25|nr:hypothetical protein [Kouleothrix sp.]HRC74306.1 hypothetical protein [Kouleothrix sp.]
MYERSAAAVLDAWERGRTLGPARQALLLLDLTGANADARQLSVGQRDTLLMELRARMFGTHIAALAECPACGERLELGFALDDVRAAPPADPAAPIDLRAGEYTLQARPPSAADLVALEAYTGLAERRTRLIECCVLAAYSTEQAVPARDLPEDLVDQLAARLAEADPQADVQLALDCPRCGHGWHALFDIVAFLWRELDAWAQRTLHDVHTLACAYGWREAEILALSAERRALYLELVRG